MILTVYFGKQDRKKSDFNIKTINGQTTHIGISSCQKLDDVTRYARAQRVHPPRAPPPVRLLGFPVNTCLQTLHSFRSPVITIFLLPHLGHRSCLPIYLIPLQLEFKRLALLSNNISFRAVLKILEPNSQMQRIVHVSGQVVDCQPVF